MHTAPGFSMVIRQLVFTVIDLQISSASSDLKQEFRPAETAAHAYINCPSLFSGKDDAKEK